MRVAIQWVANAMGSRRAMWLLALLVGASAGDDVSGDPRCAVYRDGVTCCDTCAPGFFLVVEWCGVCLTELECRSVGGSPNWWHVMCTEVGANPRRIPNAWHRGSDSDASGFDSPDLSFGFDDDFDLAGNGVPYNDWGGPPVTAEELQSVVISLENLQDMDTDGDGTVDKTEFQQWLLWVRRLRR